MLNYEKERRVMNKFRSEDEVIVIAGKDKGKRGKITKVLNDGRFIVSGIINE